MIPPVSATTGSTEQNFDILPLYKQYSPAFYRPLWNGERRTEKVLADHAGKRYKHAETDLHTGLNILCNSYN